MDNIKIVEINNPDGTLSEHVIIDRGNGEYTSMPKSTYDEMIANQEKQSGTL